MNRRVETLKHTIIAIEKDFYSTKMFNLFLSSGLTKTITFLLTLISCTTIHSVSSFAISPSSSLQRQLQATIGKSVSYNSDHNSPNVYHRQSFLMSTSDTGKYSQEVMLREEAESPFRKVRFFGYATLGSGAGVSFFLSVVRGAAALSGINPELLNESLTNAGIDLAGIIVFTLLYKWDLDSQESRLKRATKGAAFASLNIRVPSMMDDEDDVDNTEPQKFVTTNLASMRRGRGIEKRIVICAAGADKISQIVSDAKRLNDDLTLNDLLIVPVVLPQGVAPSVATLVDKDGNGDNSNHNSNFPESIALPIGNNWRSIIEDETEDARSQGVDIIGEGISIILKKNGRVGQRTKGVSLSNMVGDVEQRQQMGMDVKNI